MEWTIEEARNGLWDVFRDRRIVAYDRDDVEEAVRTIQRDRRYSPGDKITVIESDGYRRRVAQ